MPVSPPRRRHCRCRCRWSRRGVAGRFAGELAQRVRGGCDAVAAWISSETACWNRARASSKSVSVPRPTRNRSAVKSIWRESRPSAAARLQGVDRREILEVSVGDAGDEGFARLRQAQARGLRLQFGLADRIARGAVVDARIGVQVELVIGVGVAGRGADGVGVLRAAAQSDGRLERALRQRQRQSRALILKPGRAISRVLGQRGLVERP